MEDTQHKSMEIMREITPKDNRRQTVCTQKMTRKQATPGEHARHDIFGTRT